MFCFLLFLFFLCTFILFSSRFVYPPPPASARLLFHFCPFSQLSVEHRYHHYSEFQLRFCPVYLNTQSPKALHRFNFYFFGGSRSRLPRFVVYPTHPVLLCCCCVDNTGVFWSMKIFSQVAVGKRKWSLDISECLFVFLCFARSCSSFIIHLRLFYGTISKIQVQQ